MGVEDPRIARHRERALAGGAVSGVREPIRASWLRARVRRLPPDSYLPPVPLTEVEVRRRRRAHPLATVWPQLRQSLRWAAVETGGLVFVTDAEGHLLWVDGDRAMLHRAERVHLVPGALWSEEAAGTSGVGTALALRRPFQVAGAEHFLSVATGYTCTAAPIRDPATGTVLGAVDLTSGPRTARPLTMSLLSTAARLAEAELREVTTRERARLATRYAERLAVRAGTPSALVAPDGLVIHTDPPGWLPRRLPGPVAEGSLLLPDGRSALLERLTARGPYLLVTTRDRVRTLRYAGLGRDRAVLRLGGTVRELSRRHSELVAVLLAHPGGLSAEALAREVYGPEGKPLTVRAELARLRPLLGHRLASEPYRLTGPIHADFLDLDSTPAGDLLDRYPGPLLPGSRAPAVMALRDRLHERVGRQVLATGDPDALTRWYDLSR